MTVIHDTAMIRDAITLLNAPDQVIELRVPNVGGRSNNTASGYYTDPNKLAEAAARYNGRAAVYMTLHEVNPALLARAGNRVQEYAKATTTDGDIVARRYLPVDCDPARPAGISASDTEHDAALERARAIRDALRAEGWPEPIYADSGNGGHLLYRVALPADDGGLSRRALKALSARFSDGVVRVDESVHNPARIWKAYGTYTCKGDSMADRPHRLARIIDAPTDVATVPRHLLERLADTTPEASAASTRATRAAAMTFGVEAYLAGHGVGFTGPVSYKGTSLKWMLDACVWNGHTDHAAVVWQEPDGKICANCSHNSCEGKGWAELRDALEGPQWREEQAAKQRGFEERQRTWKEREQRADPAPDSGIAPIWTPPANPWPEPLAVEAFHGLPGEIVRAIEPHTESDPAALLLQLIVGAGNLIGRTPTLMMDGAAHHPNLFAVLVGTTSKARKGTSWRQIRRVLALVDPAWAEERITGGLSSGEGLIEAVADPPPDDNPSEPVDKRLMIQVGEFASVLAVQGREGNTLSAVLRDAWDGDTLTVLNRKANKLRATAPHISMVAHITRDELLRMLQTTEAANGYANRFLWAAVRRPKLLPRGGNLTDATLLPLAERLRAAVLIARRAQHITLTERAWEMWDGIYAELSRERAGLLGAITARAEPLVLRLAMLYALMDTAGEIDVSHLMAGCAVWEYCERSAAWVFGDQLGDPDGDVLLSHLRQRPEGITRTEIHGILGRNRSATQINRALTSLEEKNLARRVDEVPDGDRRQRTERWHAVHPEGK